MIQLTSLQSKRWRKEEKHSTIHYVNSHSKRIFKGEDFLCVERYAVQFYDISISYAQQH